MYTTPNDYRLEIHFPRSRWSSRGLEDALLIVSERIANLGAAKKEEFDSAIDSLLQAMNDKVLQAKTIANQRTEMISLFGLAKYREDMVVAGGRTVLLAESQDMPMFFKSLCAKFQYPGGFVKPQFNKEYVKAKVRFKPAQYIVKMLRAGKSMTGKSVAITAREIAHLVFNDARATTGQHTPADRMKALLELRGSGVVCDSTGDLIRYARDFLNYMVEAGLLTEFEKGYFLNEREHAAIDYIENDDSFFEGYNAALTKDGEIDEEVYKTAEIEWHDWFADIGEHEKEALATPLESFAKETTEVTTEDNKTEAVTTGYELPPEIQRIKEAMEAGKTAKGKNGVNLKAIGDEGEAIVYGMERERVGKVRPDLMGIVRIVSNDSSLGFDILSILDESGRKKYIEVKTTKRNYTPSHFAATAFFDVSGNEWRTAVEQGSCYFIFRVIIAKEYFSVFVIQDPKQKHEEGLIRMEPTGYRVVYEEKAGAFAVEGETYSSNSIPQRK